jgi:AraC family transcriptional regulator
MEKNRSLYISKINATMLYIQENLDKELNLDVIAKYANLSSFHFHRIFKIFTGETPIDFTQRLRIQKASQYLKYNRNLSVSEISLNCGFSSLSLFNQVFKRYYKIPPKKYRENKNGFLTKDSFYYNKKGELIDRKYKTEQLSSNIDLSELLFINTNISIKIISDISVIYCLHVGHFHLIKNAYKKLIELLELSYSQLLQEEMELLTLYFDDPTITPINKLRQGACICLDNIQVPQEVNKITLQGGKYVVGHFYISINEFEKAWNTISFWIVENNYQIRDGYDFELYHQYFGENIKDKIDFDIYIPIL